VALQQVEGGAQIIDVNMDEGNVRIGGGKWTSFLNYDPLLILNILVFQL